MKDAYLVPNRTGPGVGIRIEESLCIGCCSCANICRIQTILPNPEKGKPPIVAYPDECWYCGVCVGVCPTGALEMRLPINQRVLFKEKETGRVFRIGASDSPEKSFFKPPYGWLEGNEANGAWKAIERHEKPVAAVISSEVCTAIGAYFAEEKGKDCGNKLCGILKAMGFDKVYCSDTVPDSCRDCYSLFVGPAKDEKADCSINTKQLSEMINHGCVTRYTAVHVWRQTEEQDFD